MLDEQFKLTSRRSRKMDLIGPVRCHSTVANEISWQVDGILVWLQGNLSDFFLFHLRRSSQSTQTGAVAGPRPRSWSPGLYQLLTLLRIIDPPPHDATRIAGGVEVPRRRLISFSLACTHPCKVSNSIQAK